MNQTENIARKVEKVYGKIKGYASTTTTDNLGTRFSKSDLEKMAEYYEENPFIYYNHDMSRPPVGRVVSSKVVKVEDFYALEQESEVIDAEIWKKMETGELKGLSIGGVAGNE